MKQDKGKQQDKEAGMRDSAAGASGQGPKKDEMQGEGNYEAGRRYDEKTREYVKSHDVEQAARDAAPESAEERRKMEQAEQQGKRRAKEEDPLLDNPQDMPESDGNKPRQ